MISPTELDQWLNSREDEHLEFKQAKNHFPPEELAKYCAALANEGGGKLVLGVTNSLPHQVAGTAAYPNLGEAKYRLVMELHLRVAIHEYQHLNGRVLVFDVPSRPLGVPISYKGTYWMRSGESVMAMTTDMLKRIFAEAVQDYSAEFSREAHFEDLDAAAIKEFRTRLYRKSGNENLADLENAQLLRDVGLISDKGITYAALVLFGSAAALS